MIIDTRKKGGKIVQASTHQVGKRVANVLQGIVRPMVFHVWSDQSKQLLESVVVRLQIVC
jgi:hypothetical protein